MRVVSSDIERGKAIARQIDTGVVGISGCLSDPVAPLGGLKSSGLGVGNGPEGLASYLCLQAIRFA